MKNLLNKRRAFWIETAIAILCRQDAAKFIIDELYLPHISLWLPNHLLDPDEVYPARCALLERLSKALEYKTIVPTYN
jgi:hypothetical protein